ncbi:MAG: hypothetical protein ACRBBW_15320 [Cellvibrionaceae bacterium]
MQANIVFGFDTAQIASRFLNTVKSENRRGVKVSLNNGGLYVKVRYPLTESDGFDTICADLDDIASALGGVEISHS